MTMFLFEDKWPINILQFNIYNAKLQNSKQAKIKLETLLFYKKLLKTFLSFMCMYEFN